MERRAVQVALGLGIALLFSMIYVGLYPMLTGGFVIHWYPYWPVPLAIAYVAGGILVQIAFCCFRGTTAIPSGLVAQTLTGVAYIVLAVLGSGGLYMS